MNFNSVLNITCSKAINKESLPVDCNLLEELLSNKHEQQQNLVRNETDPDKQNTLKMAMPALWPCCLFNGGSTSKHIVNHTGLIVVDIDAKDNQHIANFHNLKNEICKIPNVAYCGLSVRGKGYFLIIPITYPDEHKQHYQFIVEHFKKRGLNVDPVCKNINRLRFCSYDSEAYYNHAAKPLQAYYKPPIKKTTQQYRKGNNSLQLAGNVFSKAMEWVSNKGVQFVEGQRHEFIFLLCSYLQSMGVKKSDAESWIDSNLMPLTEITTNCIEYPFANYAECNTPTIVKTPAAVANITTVQENNLIKDIDTFKPFATNYNMQHLQAMAMKHLNKTLLKDKVAAKANYMALWANDMAGFIQGAGFTQQQFLQTINI